MRPSGKPDRLIPGKFKTAIQKITKKRKSNGSIMQHKHVIRSKLVILILHDSVLWVIFPSQEVAGADKPATNLKCYCYSVFLRQVCVSFPLSKQFKELQSSSILEA